MILGIANAKNKYINTGIIKRVAVNRYRLEIGRRYFNGLKTIFYNKISRNKALIRSKIEKIIAFNYLIFIFNANINKNASLYFLINSADRNDIY